VLQAHRQSPSHRRLQKHAKSQGPLLRRHYPASTLIRPCPTPAMAVAFRDVEAATLATDGSPPITRTTFPTCRAHYPGGSSGCSCRLLPAPVGAFPVWQVGRHPHCHFRGLLRLHSRYGPPDRSATQGDLCHEAPAQPVAQPSRSSASGPIDNSPGGILLHRCFAPSGRTARNGHASFCLLCFANYPRLCTLTLWRRHRLPRR
jgi:hypothetical protein